MRARKKIAVSLSWFLAVGVVSACGREKVTVESEKGDIEVEILKDGTSRGRAKDGTSFAVVPEGEKSLPEGFPEDVPAFPGAKVVMNSMSPDHGLMVMFKSSDAPQQIADFYKKRLHEEGWDLEQEAKVAGQHMLLAKKETRELNVLVGEGEEGAQIAVSVRTEQ